MLDAAPAKIVQTGEVIITQTGIQVRGFSGDNASCREIAALAAAWAIGELQRELVKTLEAPGKSGIRVEPFETGDFCQLPNTTESSGTPVEAAPQPPDSESAPEKDHNTIELF